MTFGASLLVVLLMAWLVWPTPYRAIPLSLGATRFLAAREHRVTGRVEFLTPTGWHRATTRDPLDSLVATAPR